jgi:4,5-DOPA dioxygenase extradiol
MSTKLPVLFIGHGNPMNAIKHNAFTESLERLGKEIPRPEAVLCISAHWMTEGTWITEMEHPKTIHDFYGFPQELFDVQYNSPGSPEIADRIRALVTKPRIIPDVDMWGLDHGTWSVLKHMYPKADIPVMQLSLNMHHPAQDHFDLGVKLRALREQNILIVGSGNIVHNLRKIKWGDDASAYDWAVEFDEWMKERLLKKDYETIIKDATNSEAGKLSIPTMDHWFPLFYVLGASTPEDTLKFEYEGIENGSISMRTFTLGNY